MVWTSWDAPKGGMMVAPKSEVGESCPKGLQVLKSIDSLGDEEMYGIVFLFMLTKT